MDDEEFWKLEDRYSLLLHNNGWHGTGGDNFIPPTIDHIVTTEEQKAIDWLRENLEHGSIVRDPLYFDEDYKRKALHSGN
jgi:hypothetical protein